MVMPVNSDGEEVLFQKAMKFNKIHRNPWLESDQAPDPACPAAINNVLKNSATQVDIEVNR